MRTKLFLSVLLILFCFSTVLADGDYYRIKVHKPTTSDESATDGKYHALEGIKYHKCNWWCIILEKYFNRCCVGYKTNVIL